MKHRVSPEPRLVQPVFIPSGALPYANLVTDLAGPSVLESLSEEYEKHSLALANGEALVQPNQPFVVLIATLSVHDRILKKDRVTGTLLPHARYMVSKATTSLEPCCDESKLTGVGSTHGENPGTGSG